MNRNHSLALVVACSVALSAGFGEAASSGTFGGWRVSGGAKFGFGLRTRLNSTVPQSFYSSQTSSALGPGAAIGTTLIGGTRVDFIDGAFIDPVSGTWTSPFTQNWRIPVSGVDTTLGTMNFYSQQISGSSVNASGGDDDVGYGASIALERTVFAHESGFGLDFGISLDWMRANDCYRSGNSGLYLSRTRYTYTPTPATGNATVMAGIIAGALTPSGGYYGAGSPTGIGPVLDYSDFTAATITSTSTTSGYSMSASGDYEEWEILLMLKPWYEVTPWWRLTGTVGLAVTRSEFAYSVMADFGQDGVYRSSNTMAEWRCCPIAGLGTIVKVGAFDVSCDFLVRIAPGDMTVNADGVSGKIEKPDCFLRLAAGLDF